MGHSKFKESTRSPANPSVDEISGLHGSQVWLLVVSALLLIRLVDTPDLWWTLARGRQVFSGSLTPSSDLLTLDSGREADWLSGVPFYAFWSLFGVHAISVVPLIAGCFLVWRCSRSSLIARDRYFYLLVVPLLIIPLRGGLTTDPVLWDLVLLMSLGKVLSDERPQTPSPLVVCAFFLLWGNLGPRPLWGLLLLLTYQPITKHTPKLLLAAILGGIVNPRGFFAWWDSLACFSPFLFIEPAQFYDPAWAGLCFQPQFELSTLLFLVAWGFWIATEIRGGYSIQKIVVWAIPLLACLISISNLPLAAAWILAAKVLNASEADEDSAADEAAVPDKPLLMRGMMCVVTCLVLVDCLGWSGASAGRLAWGIDSINDVRLLNLDQLPRKDQPYVGWTMDRRAAGMIAWLEEPVVAADHPQRALWGGRWNEHAQVMTDLVTSHRAQYQLEDGSWGGWVAQLKDWEIDLLFVPAASQSMHAALLETPWKPFDLDSPVVPYLNADDIALAEMVVESLRQQGFVETGPWQPTLAMLDSQGWRFQPETLLGRGPNPESTIRQSQLFRGLDLPTASLRVLLPVRQVTNNPDLRREFLECQLDLAYQEWLTFGATSEFRRAVVENSTQLVDRETSSEFWQSLQHADTQGLTQDAALFLQLYEQGNIVDAIRMLTPDTPQRQYARAMLWLELGDSVRAQQELQQVAKQATDPGIHYAAQFWIEQIAPYASP